jgi:hypothetical protein
VAALTVIVGYCGSGKTWLLDCKRVERPAAGFMDEGFLSPGNARDLTLKAEILQALGAGRDCYITLMDCGLASNRDALTDEIGRAVPGTTITWIFFENDVSKANQNCLRDPARRGARAQGNVEQNHRWAASYSLPEGVGARPIFELPDSGEDEP